MKVERKLKFTWRFTIGALAIFDDNINKILTLVWNKKAAFNKLQQLVFINVALGSAE
jgi:hypothetical protein